MDAAETAVKDDQAAAAAEECAGARVRAVRVVVQEGARAEAVEEVSLVAA